MRCQAGTRTDLGEETLEPASAISPLAARRSRARSAAVAGRFAGMQSGVPADTDGMPVRLHHIAVDAHDLPGLARFWAQALGWKVLPGREREIVIGTG